MLTPVGNVIIGADCSATNNAPDKLKSSFLRYNFVGCEIITNFAPEFIPHLRKGNRKTQALMLCVFCFYIRLGNLLRLYLLIILFLAASLPSSGYAVSK